ncbi:MAG: phosphopantothenate/pantothenate synthetase family protein, partial [archaeon]|nr:phosphopantothenate/pantothenate synthetase family protein [archaeon]
QARKQIEAAAAMLLLAKRPVISVNGNVAALCPKEVAALAKALGAKIEANVFYAPAKKRKRLIAKEFEKIGAQALWKSDAKIKGLSSERANVSREGIYSADAVLVMLEDGDRTMALHKAKKKVVAIDLNPMSRTPKTANIAIIDDVTRALPLLEKKVVEYRSKKREFLERKVKKFDNPISLRKSEERIRRGNEKT